MPEILVSDNGKQFTSREFQIFAKEWGFKHVTTSPHYPQANGEEERAVQTAKKILSQNDPALALLIYRDTPIKATGYSPAQLASGRRLRTTLPTLSENLEPRVCEKSTVAASDAKAKKRNKQTFDRHHGVRPLDTLLPGDIVMQKLDGEKSWRGPAVVQQQVAPRSYVVESWKRHEASSGATGVTSGAHMVYSLRSPLPTPFLSKLTFPYAKSTSLYPVTRRAAQVTKHPVQSRAALTFTKSPAQARVQGQYPVTTPAAVVSAQVVEGLPEVHLHRTPAGTPQCPTAVHLHRAPSTAARHR